MACENCLYGNNHYETDEAQSSGFPNRVECLHPYRVDQIVEDNPKDAIRGRFKSPRYSCCNFDGSWRSNGLT
jgi:hypothetical protein